MNLVLIPDGEFMMGSPDSDDEASDWEKPRHTARITMPFYLGMCEVTQVEYEKVMGENPSYLKGAGNPVEQVSWYDPVEFCKRLSAKEGKTYRLPTEAEWEYACRAGTTTLYSFGDDTASLEKYAWYEDNSDWKTHPVGQKKPNAWGLHDMHGNTWEWCADRWADDSYTASPMDDPPRAETGSGRVIRGGGWKDAIWDCRAANRSAFVPTGRLPHLGFRVAAVPPSKPSREQANKKAERGMQAHSRTHRRPQNVPPTPKTTN